MKKDVKLIENTVKLGLAIASIVHPAFTLVEPGLNLIVEIVRNNQAISKYELHMKKKLNRELKECVKKTLISMKEDVSSDTRERALEFLDSYIQFEFSNRDVKDISYSFMKEMLHKSLKRNEIYYEIYLNREDIKYFIDAFYDKFNIYVLEFAELSSYYNQRNIRINHDSITELWQEIDKLKQEYYNKHPTKEKIKQMLNCAFNYERKLNPSAEKTTYAEDLTPKGNVKEYLITAKINKEREHVPVIDYFNETWQTNEQNHISITGIGGIGKTVALFNINYPVPAIYIPLRNLTVSKNDSNEEYITEYIQEHTLLSADNAYHVLMQLCNESWDNGPRIILLLDGLNEIKASKLDSVIREIRTKWAPKQGVQLILTSRYDINTKLQLDNVNQMLLDTLSKDTISNHLKNKNVELPSKSDYIWDIIDTPLMLNLYTNSAIAKTLYNSELANWRDAKNGGSIIWNYVQSELCKPNIHNQLENIVAIHFFAPYICYKMMLNNDFNIPENKFRDYLTEAHSLYEKLKIAKALPALIIKAINENEHSKITEEHFYNLLTKNFNIFKARNGSIQLIHQHFRDCLAAIHIIQIADNAKTIPTEWKEIIDPYVTTFISDLLITERTKEGEKSTWGKIWDFGYQKEINSRNYILQMLNIFAKVYGIDISTIDFSNVDLTEIPLGTFKLTKESKNNFIDSLIGFNTFWGKGHTDTVSSTSWCCNGNYYLTASHDCTLRIHNASDNSSTILDKQHDHYIRCAKFSPTDAKKIASAGDDQKLILWKHSSYKDEEGNNIDKWVPEKLGECSNWIRTLTWDNEGKRIVCGDESGNITLFKGNKKTIFDIKHDDSVKHIKWSRSHSCIFASGSDDGTVYVFHDDGKILEKIILEDTITSLSWIQNDKILLVSTTQTVYFYAIEYKSTDNKILIKSKRKKQIDSSDRISCITTNNLDNVDYVAIFYDEFVEVLGITFLNLKLAIDCVGKFNYKRETNKIISADWNSTCDKLICGSRDGSFSSIELLKEEDKERLIFSIVGTRCNQAARCSCWSPKGEYLAVGYDDCKIRIWNPFTECCLAVLRGHTDSIKCLAWSPDGQSIVSGSDDNTVKIWQGKNFEGVEPKTIYNHDGPVNAVLWLKNNTIVSAGDDKRFVCVNLNSEIILEKKEHKKKIYSLALSPDERYILSGGNDDYICMWDMNTHECNIVESGHSKPIRALAWSNNGEYIISSSNDCTIKLRKVDPESICFVSDWEILPQNHRDFIYGANISKNNIFVVGGSTDSTVGIWKINEKEFIHKSNAHKGFVWNVSTSPKVNDKYYAATSSSDGTVKIWDLTNAEDNIIEPIFNLPVIPESDFVGCDFSGAIIENSTLKRMLLANGGVINE